MASQYEILPDGKVVVDGETPRLSAQEESIFKKNVLRWDPQVTKYSKTTGVPRNWGFATIFAESLGNPGAVSSDGGFGLFQLTSSAARQGIPGPQTLDPDVNTRLGMEFLAKVRRGEDLIRTSAAYNAGSPRACAGCDFGLVATKGYLVRIAKANNTAIDTMGSSSTAPAPGASAWVIGGALLGVVASWWVLKSKLF